MNKPAFDPNQPFESSKPAFDPNQPFVSGDQQSAPSGMEPSLSNIAQLAPKMLGAVAPMEGEFVRQNLPVIGASVGSALLPGAGTALGAGTGQIAKRMIGIATGKEPPAGTPLQEATGPMLQAAGSGLLELSPVKNAIQAGAQNLGRRALGFTKGMLKKVGIEGANETAQEMLDKGVIKPLSGARATLERAEDLAQTSGQAVGEGLRKAGQNALDTNDVASNVIDQLSPKLKGGAYDAQEKAAQEVVDTVMAHGNGPISWDNAQALKQKLGELARFNSGTDNLKATMYRRAYGIVSDAIEKGVAAGDASAAPGYLANKATYGASQQAIRALTDKANAEASNSALSLRGAAIAAGSLASGHVTPALEALGAWEAARRVGASTGAAALHTLNNSPLAQNARRAILSELISRLTTKENAQ